MLSPATANGRVSLRLTCCIGTWRHKCCQRRCPVSRLSAVWWQHNMATAGIILLLPFQHITPSRASVPWRSDAGGRGHCGGDARACCARRGGRHSTAGPWRAGGGCGSCHEGGSSQHPGGGCRCGRRCHGCVRLCGGRRCGRARARGPAGRSCVCGAAGGSSGAGRCPALHQGRGPHGRQGGPPRRGVLGGSRGCDKAAVRDGHPGNEGSPPTWHVRFHQPLQGLVPCLQAAAAAAACQAADMRPVASPLTE